MLLQPAGHAVHCLGQLGDIRAAGLRHIRLAAALAAYLRCHKLHQFSGLDPIASYSKYRHWSVFSDFFAL